MAAVMWQLPLVRVAFPLSKTALTPQKAALKMCGSNGIRRMRSSANSMEDELKKHLGEDVKRFGRGGGGCINSGQGYETKSLGKIFVKTNIKKGSDVMFRGEAASLKAMYETNTVRVPKPIDVVNLGAHGWGLITEYIDMGGGSRQDLVELGTQLARMHKYNEDRLAESSRSGSFVGSSASEDSYKDGVKQFGFHTVTCCGFLPQKNDWCDDWATFFIRNRLKMQVDLLIEKGNRDVLSVWPELERKAAALLAPCAGVVPALVHGDLWGGNWSSSSDGPVIFDPASAFCDPEFEQGIMDMFGGYGKDFWAAYHAVLPKRPDRSKRVLLYELFHSLNHWNHFGSSYRGSSMTLISQVLSS